MDKLGAFGYLIEEQDEVFFSDVIPSKQVDDLEEFSFHEKLAYLIVNEHPEDLEKTAGDLWISDSYEDLLESMAVMAENEPGGLTKVAVAYINATEPSDGSQVQLLTDAISADLVNPTFDKEAGAWSGIGKALRGIKNVGRGVGSLASGLRRSKDTSLLLKKTVRGKRSLLSRFSRKQPTPKTVRRTHGSIPVSKKYKIRTESPLRKGLRKVDDESLRAVREGGLLHGIKTGIGSMGRQIRGRYHAPAFKTTTRSIDNAKKAISKHEAELAKINEKLAPLDPSDPRRIRLGSRASAAEKSIADLKRIEETHTQKLDKLYGSHGGTTRVKTEAPPKPESVESPKFTESNQPGHPVSAPPKPKSSSASSKTTSNQPPPRSRKRTQAYPPQQKPGSTGPHKPVYKSKMNRNAEEQARIDSARARRSEMSGMSAEQRSMYSKYKKPGESVSDFGKRTQWKVSGEKRINQSEAEEASRSLPDYNSVRYHAGAYNNQKVRKDGKSILDTIAEENKSKARQAANRNSTSAKTVEENAKFDPKGVQNQRNPKTQAADSGTPPPQRDPQSPPKDATPSDIANKPSLGSIHDKWSNGGWESLSPAEKRRVYMYAGGAFVAQRAVMDKPII